MTTPIPRDGAEAAIKPIIAKVVPPDTCRGLVRDVVNALYGAAAPTVQQFSACTFNIGPATPADFAALADGQTFLGCQEASDQQMMTAAYRQTHPDMRGSHSADPGKDAVPIFTHADFANQVVTKYHLAVGVRWVGLRGAGLSDHSHRKYITEMIAGDLHILNTHLIPSYTKSKAYLGLAEWRARQEHVHDHVEAIRTVVRGMPRDEPVILLGDLNGHPDRPELKPLHDIGFVGWNRDDGTGPSGDPSTTSCTCGVAASRSWGSSR